ncbi:ADP-ribose glycohydrolase OARD1-like [Sycon ciliatum]|uniref:ADP-ribose glycohydrolase OARD1-like n=1 Tax=Sycon ciliatum TaxID=27933 RepID=UPI0020AAE717|eukprot:scpid86935/ scgid17124/ O-acetyl-ADP-ribose deacetylase C6orf130 homolog
MASAEGGVGGILTEVKGDLFSSPATAALAHCISADVRMGAGIAKIFKAKFGGVSELQRQGARPGGLASLQRSGRFVYYLVTKEKYYQKPTYETLRQSLQSMRAHCEANGVKHVCMPKIGCGLDGLEWARVAKVIRDVFSGSPIQLTVYVL